MTEPTPNAVDRPVNAVDYWWKKYLASQEEVLKMERLAQWHFEGYTDVAQELHRLKSLVTKLSAQYPMTIGRHFAKD